MLLLKWNLMAVDKLIWDKEGNMMESFFLQGLLHFNPRPICCQCYKTFFSIIDASGKAGVFLTLRCQQLSFSIVNMAACPFVRLLAILDQLEKYDKHCSFLAEAAVPRKKFYNIGTWRGKLKEILTGLTMVSSTN
jgi:hypothetical protein